VSDDLYKDLYDAEWVRRDQLQSAPPNPRMQPTGRRGAGFRPGGAPRWRYEGIVGLCGRGHGGPQLMRMSLGGSKERML
jgi:hypothetical protein